MRAMRSSITHRTWHPSRQLCVFRYCLCQRRAGPTNTVHLSTCTLTREVMCKITAPKYKPSQRKKNEESRIDAVKMKHRRHAKDLANRLLRRAVPLRLLNFTRLSAADGLGLESEVVFRTCHCAEPAKNYLYSNWPGFNFPLASASRILPSMSLENPPTRVTRVPSVVDARNLTPRLCQAGDVDEERRQKSNVRCRVEPCHRKKA